MKEIKYGIILNYLYILSNFAIGLIFTPILIKYLGQSDYGIYSLALAIAGYLSLLDLGVGNSIVRYVSKNKVDGSKKEEAKLIGYFFKFFSFISFLTIIIGFSIAFNLDYILSEEFADSEVVTLKYMLIILTINFAIGFVFNTFSAVLQAYEFFIFIKFTSLVRAILTPLITYIALLLESNLIVLTLIILFVNTSVLISTYIYYKCKLNLKMSFKKINNSLRREIFLYALIIFIVVIADKLYWQTGQILLSIYSNPLEIAIYALAIQFINIFLSLSGALNGIFLPRITKSIYKDRNIKSVEKLYINISKYQMIIVSLFLGGFLFFGRNFIGLWVGIEYEVVYYIVLVLMSTFYFDLIQNLGNTILQAKGKYYFRAAVLISCAVINLFVVINFIDNYGIKAISVSTAVFIFIGNVLIMNYYYHKKLEINMLKYWGKLGGKMLVLIIFNVAFYYVNLIIPIQEMSNSWFTLTVKMAIYFILYIIIIYNLLLESFEQEWLRNNLRVRKI